MTPLVQLPHDAPLQAMCKVSAAQVDALSRAFGPPDAARRRPVGPMWGSLGALGTMVGTTYAGRQLGRQLGAQLATRGAAPGTVGQMGRYGLYGGALLGVPLAAEVGKWIARSPRWGISDWLYY